MSHGITGSDMMVSVRETPWHGVRIVLETPPRTTAEVLELAGLDWRVTKRPVFHQLGGNLGDLAFEPIPGAWATIRKDTNMVLGVVGVRYCVAQNDEALQFLDNLIGSSLHLETPAACTAAARSGRSPSSPTMSPSEATPPTSSSWSRAATTAPRRCRQR